MLLQYTNIYIANFDAHTIYSNRLKIKRPRYYMHAISFISNTASIVELLKRRPTRIYTHIPIPVKHNLSSSLPFFSL